jgi:RNA polymerase sigma-70 factor (ECF subfamily)
LATTDSWEALIDLLRPIHESAVATARRLSRCPDDGDDLFQEAVLRAYEKLPSLRDPSRFRSWFYCVLLTVHRNRHRRGFWRRFLSLDRHETGQIDPAGEDGTVWEERRRGAERVSRALAGLPAVQREAIVLFEIEGFSVEEIAAMQKVSHSAVKSRLARGRSRLRRYYERLDANTPYPASVGGAPGPPMGRARSIADRAGGDAAATGDRPNHEWSLSEGGTR